jgi:hypothetical protein
VILLPPFSALLPLKLIEQVQIDVPPQGFCNYP